MPEYDFSDKVAFVTGGARGQGRNHAVQYAKYGADVVVGDICKSLDTVPYELSTRGELEETVEMIENEGRQAVGVEMDIRDEGAVADAVERAIDEFDRIDILANNAGVNSSAPLLQMEEEMWDEMLDTNLKGMWHAAKHVGRKMVDQGDGGKIVNTASNFAFTAAPTMGHYVSSKHGVIGLTKTLALELAEHDVNVNAVSPTAANTALMDGMLAAGDEDLLEAADELAGPSNIFDPEDPLIEPQDITEAFLWLSSDAARYVTGTTLEVDAGYTAK
jgi:SDR family mycofactocin-dependent oxidoreductase